MSVSLTPPMFLQFFVPGTNQPAVGSQLFTYIAGTSTKQATWTDSTQLTQSANPIVADSNGVMIFWLDPTLQYKFVWAAKGDTDPPSSPIYSVDNISGIITSAVLTQSFIGSILYPRTATEAAAGIIPTLYFYPPGNWLRYGADPTGVSDSTTAITNAAKSGAIAQGVFGTFLIAGTIALGLLPRLVGAGQYTTILKTISPAANVISVPALANYSISDLSIASSVTRTGGAYISTGAAYGIIERLSLTGYYTGIQDGDNVTVIRDCVFTSPVVSNGVGVAITQAAGGVVLDNLLFNAPGAGNQPSCGVLVTNCGAVQITNCNIIQQGAALNLVPNTGQVVASVYADNTFFDSSAIGINIAPQGTAAVVRCRFANCWTSSTTSGPGVAINAGGGGIDGIDLVNHQAFNCVNNGVNLISAVNVNIIGGAFCGNTTTSGIAVSANVSRFSIMGATCGSGYGFAGNVNGITLGGGHSNYRISQCNLLGNSGSAISGSGSAGASWVVENSGYNPVGTAAITVGASPFTHTAGQTPETVYVSGGTVSGITVAGLATGLTSGSFRLNPFQSLVVTYTVAPTAMGKSVD